MSLETTKLSEKAVDSSERDSVLTDISNSPPQQKSLQSFQRNFPHSISNIVFYLNTMSTFLDEIIGLHSPFVCRLAFFKTSSGLR